MKIIFLVYPEVMDDRITKALENAGVDFYTEWENVKWKGHNTMPHLGTRTFPGLNCVRMIDFEDEVQLENLVCEVQKLNKDIKLKEDLIRLYQIPLERII